MTGSMTHVVGLSLGWSHRVLLVEPGANGKWASLLCDPAERYLRSGHVVRRCDCYLLRSPTSVK